MDGERLERLYRSEQVISGYETNSGRVKTSLTDRWLLSVKLSGQAVLTPLRFGPMLLSGNLYAGESIVGEHTKISAISCG